MFMTGERQRLMRAMIMAPDGRGRRAALLELLPLQEADFIGIFEAMSGLPVTIRLLDPPLHEFVPDVEELRETNPMLGTRGCRLAILHPEIYEMQVEAIARAFTSVERAPRLEIMIPLVGFERELVATRALVERVVSRHGLEPGRDYTVGTMIELPRACVVADRIARHADFFSFGTNDLTQTALGFSRDDVEATFIPAYTEQQILDCSPFETLDTAGVGWLLRLAARIGRQTKPGLKLGVCGEHAGDPKSIVFFHRAGLDYVSCSPPRIPVARIAAAQAAIAERG
jgi:pyruvate, orthophosphate dikinase